MRWRLPAVLLLGALTAVGLTGCAGTVKYAPPSPTLAPRNSVIVAKPGDAVWKELIPVLGKKFFVVNNIDRLSGFMNVSYSGDPERYVDCGQVSSYVRNARGERTYNFPASKAHQTYEVMRNGALYSIDYRMALEGRINILVEDISAQQTRITANTRYVVTRTLIARGVTSKVPETATHSAAFNFGGNGVMPWGSTQLVCRATGQLENEVLDAFK